MIIFQGRLFAFDKVLKPNVTQDYVYSVAAKPIVSGRLLFSHVQDNKTLAVTKLKAFADIKLNVAETKGRSFKVRPV